MFRKTRKEIRRADYMKKIIWGICLFIFVMAVGRMIVLREKDTASKVDMTPEAQALRIVAKMSDGEKIGQLLIIGVPGTAFDESTRYMLNQYSIGGIILFDRNMDTPQQVRNLTGKIQQTARDNDMQPLFVGIDEEGGSVARMQQYIPLPPAAGALGAAGDLAGTKSWARATAQTLMDLGINVNFAPDADLGIPGRSYASAPDIVAKFIEAAGSGYAERGMVYTLKHFPGIGKGQMDSHIDGSVINVSREQLEAEDVAPFRTAIQNSSKTDDFFIMVSHLTYPTLDAENPASMSPKIMQKLLREKLGFTGLIITDDMEMGAISNHYDFEDVGVKAINAGADMILVCHEQAHQVAVYDGMLKALQDGRLNRKSVDDAVVRIISLKLKKIEDNKNLNN